MIHFNKKIILIFILFLFLPILSWADTHVSASCAVADVQAAHDAAEDGDIVTVPSCATTQWATPLNITKGITLQGAGKTATFLQWNGARGTTGGSTRDVMIRLVPTSNKTMRVTGFSIDMVAMKGEDGASTERVAIAIVGSVSNSFAITDLRIDNNAFNMGGYTIKPYGYVEGVIDNNTFTNPSFAVGCVGDNDYAWGRGVTAGTGNMLFIEDNTIIFTADTTQEPAQAFGHGNGCRTVIRYNTVDGTANTAYSSYFLDIHGNQGSGGGPPTYYLWNTARGDPIHEIYNNTFTAHHSTGNNLAFQRSGSMLFYNNSFSVITGTPSVPYLYEEEGWYCPPYASDTRYYRCKTLDGTSSTAGLWPGMDQITNTHFWNNSCNWVGTYCVGGYLTTVLLSGNAQTDFIQEGRDYHFHAPQASDSQSCTYGNVSYRGHSTTYPTDGSLEPLIATQLTTLSCAAGTDFHYPYTPYFYPHPLRGLGKVQGITIQGGSIR